ncbi:IPT/TIG domain-containing protein [Actinoplanes sp. URMC 104]|uniref:IPT/TIG domain-containing protein n=1 Tax=Actinoplanes sp. URMC 104 TaxID=3423409 RepID=UPI003F1D93E6
MAKANAPIAATGTTTTAGVLTVNPDDVKWIAANKIAFRVPNSPYPAEVASKPSEVNPNGLVLAGTQTTARWNVCVYDNPSTTSSTLLATAAYTLAVRPKITAIIPASSPASGGQLITVTGTGFGAGTTASIGGAALTGVKVAPNGASFTGITPSRTAASNLTMTVNTPGGPVLSSDPDNNGREQDDVDATPDEPIYFTYRNGVTVSPNTATAGSKVDVSIKGVGFQSLTFKETAASTDATAHVFLVKDAYNQLTNRGVQECKRVMVVSNTELICTFDLLGARLNPDGTPADGPVAEGTYTVTVVANGATDAGDLAAPTVLSSGATFTVGPF